MKNKKISVWSPIICFLCTVVWTANVCVDLSFYSQLNWLIALQGSTAFIWLAAAIVDLLRYRRTIGNQDL